MAVPIGLDMIHFALLTSDTPAVGETPGAAVYQTPERLIGAKQLDVNPNTDTSTFFADDGPMETSTSLGNIDVTLNIADVPLKQQSVLHGHKYHNGAIVKTASDTPPYVAIGGRCLNSDGTYNYFWYYKGKFATPEQSKKTKEETVEYQVPVLKGAFVKRDADGAWEIEYSENSTEYNPAVSAKWFTKVMEQADIVAKPQ